LQLQFLSSSYTRSDGETLTGATGSPPLGGFSIVDSFNTPAVNGAYVNTIPIDTRYGGGYGTGTTGGFGNFDASTVDTMAVALPHTVGSAF
jgi:hypothetical protein